MSAQKGISKTGSHNWIETVFELAFDNVVFDLQIATLYNFLQNSSYQFMHVINCECKIL